MLVFWQQIMYVSYLFVRMRRKWALALARGPGGLAVPSRKSRSPQGPPPHPKDPQGRPNNPPQRIPGAITRVLFQPVLKRLASYFNENQHGNCLLILGWSGGVCEIRASIHWHRLSKILQNPCQHSFARILQDSTESVPALIGADCLRFCKNCPGSP